MYQFIATIIPNIIGTYLINKKTNNKNILKTILFFAIFTILTNCILSLAYYLKSGLLYMDFACLFFVKYCILSVLLNIGLFYIYTFIIDNFSFKKTKENKLSKKDKKNLILHSIWILLIIILLVGSFYIKKEYSNENADELYFYLTHGIGDSDGYVFLLAIKKCILYVALLFIVIISLFYNPLNNKKVLYKNKYKIYPIDITMKYKYYISIVITILFIIISLSNVKVFKYIKNQISTSDFIKDNYVTVTKEDIVSNGDEKNLITIYVESLETSLFSKEHGGSWDYEVLPELYDLLTEEDSIYFSNKEVGGGVTAYYGTEWTTAALIAGSTGLPFKIPIDGNSYTSDKFMNGSYALGDVLEDHGYTNEVISAATTDFGGIEDFYTNHGNYKILDSESFGKYGIKLEDNDMGSWGINDNCMYEIAKDRLSILSESDKPFNLTLIGIDTHFPEGFKGYYTLNKFDNQYENVYATESKLIYDFVSWIKEQDFYKNTVIVIIGDHASMQTSMFEGLDTYTDRTKYNVIINSSVTTENTKNRLFSTMDIYPTTLSAMGFEIKDNKIALGVNLFSNEQTLIEKYGLSESMSELEKKSEFYNDEILGSDYYKMRQTIETN